MSRAAQISRRRFLRPDGGGTAHAVAHAAIRIRASLSDRPVQVIVTSVPGGQGDTTARLLLVLPKSPGRPINI
jgi:hypothetical protein